MSRSLDLGRRQQLLEQTIGYAAVHGIATLSLRPLAESLGTSSRMLVHYFGTKDELIAQTLRAARPDIPAVLAEHRHTGDSPEEMVGALWRDLTDGGEQEPRTRLMLEVMTLALTQQELYGEYAADAVRAWVEPLAVAFVDDGYPTGRAHALATLLVSGLRGLALDLYVTGDKQRLDAAAAELIGAVIRPADEKICE